MEKKESINETIENFPFLNFEELRKEIYKENVSIGFVESDVLAWAGKSKKAPNVLKMINKLEPIILFFIVLLFFIFIISMKLWWWLLSLPLLFLATIMFGPTLSRTMGNPGLYLIAFFLGSLIYSIFSSNFGLLAFSSSLLLIDFSINTLHSVTGKIIQNIAADDEEVFRELWRARIVGIMLSDGQSYFSPVEEEK